MVLFLCCFWVIASVKVKLDRIIRSMLKKNANVTAWAGFLIISVLVWKLVSDGDFSFIMVGDCLLL